MIVKILFDIIDELDEEVWIIGVPREPGGLTEVNERYRVVCSLVAVGRLRLWGEAPGVMPSRRGAAGQHCFRAVHRTCDVEPQCVPVGSFPDSRKLRPASATNAQTPSNKTNPQR